MIFRNKLLSDFKVFVEPGSRNMLWQVNNEDGAGQNSGEEKKLKLEDIDFNDLDKYSKEQLLEIQKLVEDDTKAKFEEFRKLSEDKWNSYYNSLPEDKKESAIQEDAEETQQSLKELDDWIDLLNKMNGQTDEQNLDDLKKMEERMIKRPCFELEPPLENKEKDSSPKKPADTPIIVSNKTTASRDFT